MSRAIIKEFFKKKIEEGGDVETILEWNKQLCYMFPEDIHESEVVFQSKRITELEERIKTYKKALELMAEDYLFTTNLSTSGEVIGYYIQKARE